MGDDEFFSTMTSLNQTSFTLASSKTSRAGSTGTAATARNPLTLDELTGFSRQLLNIAFTLYWREEPAGESGVPGMGTAFRWEVIRERLTKCLQAIHARE
jgi:ubiquitin-protein ligase E3 C